MCSGKVYYDLDQRRSETNRDDVAVIRLEQLYPLRKDELQATLAEYSKDADLVWVQEEPRNMGAWFYITAWLPELLDDSRRVRCVSREASASPATGSKAAHEIEQGRLLDEAFA
jgi:2-oxoglutarate dehydrogenase E1 component